MKRRVIKKRLFFLLILLILPLFFLLPSKKEEEMKDLSTYTKKEVEAYAKEEELELQIEEEYSESVPKDQMISQSIPKGKRFHHKDHLKVKFSLGKIDNNVYQDSHVDELGFVPIMMYHGIYNKKDSETEYTGGNVDYDGYQRTSESFKRDLETFYQEGYYIIPLKDYIKGEINVPLGKSPMILTFDDGFANNMQVIGKENGKIQIDPNSAVGIMEEFKKKHPDYPVTATFFLNAPLFRQSDYEEEIFDYMIEHGYDIGNHTYSHPDFTELTYEEAVEEVGSMYQILEEKLKDHYVHIIALPYGSPYDKDHENFPAILSGNYNGFEYHTDAMLQVGWESNFSPYSKNFEPQFMKRIRAYDNNGEGYDIEMNLERLKNTRFISDGDSNQITIKKEDMEYLNENTSRKIVTY